ncbi:DUF294 nucleotidyltransferase-like domain-containing protein [Halalkalibacter okhensis]|uniref:Signal transduction protein n=1 Tax=Halalkalibacter okhensis TaxID=333138 RepID=A0A0B0IBT3_9BACI|nr:DUF294 nucleotidyltransferase-like domain-containing protein [Halalkalibacter okhensis]KHF38750.1 hypothetical protein LQ50_19535 [Halalkalibacter okhensis]
MRALENKFHERIRKHPIFKGLSDHEFAECLGACALRSYQKGDKVLYKKAPREGLLLILQGVAEVFVAQEHGKYHQKEVLEVLEQDDMIGFSSLADFLDGKTEDPTRYEVEVAAVCETVCLHIPSAVVKARFDDPIVRDFALQQATIRLRDIYGSLAEQVQLANKWGESEPFIRLIHDVMNEPVVVADMDDDVQDIAGKMVEHSTSSVVVLNDSDQLIGIVTEKDLVQRVVARGLGAGTVAREIMTPHPFIIARDAYYYEAMSSFLMNGIKHLPVMDGGRVIGMVTLSDLLRKKNRGTIELLQTVEESTVETLHELKPAFYDVLGHLIQDGIPTVHTLEVMTKLYDRFVRHAIDLAVKEVGQPPVAFAWYMMGSGGRKEQFMLTDQDHFLVYADGGDLAMVEAYFETLGAEIVRCLEAAGYKRCKGLMMASESQWRGTLSAWKERLRSWGVRATNENILLAHNFLAFRFVYGDEALHDQFVVSVTEQLERSRIFLFRMAELEKEQPVPTFDHPIRALFRMKRESVDLKKQALFPFHHCLQLLCARKGLVGGGSPLEQLEWLVKKKIFSENTADELRFAYEVVLRIRVERGWEAYRKGEQSGSLVDFNQLRTKDKEELLLALKTIRSLQNQVVGMH